MDKLYLPLFVLSVLPTDGHLIQLKFLNLTANIYSPCPAVIKTCPQTDDENIGRMLCMFLQPSCPSDKMFYFCDIDSRTNVLVEDCFHLNKCDAGSKNSVRLDLKPINSTVSLDCVQCSEYRIQRQPHDSSQRFTSVSKLPQRRCNDIKNDMGCLECDDSRITIDFKNMLPKMKLILERWPSGFDIYACDSTRGYSNKYKTSLCDATSLCSCITDIKCTDPNKPQLLPNGQCDAVCDKERDSFQDFSCASYSADLSTSNPTETGNSKIPESIPDTTQSSTDKPQGKPNQESSSVGAVSIVLVCVGIVAVGIVVVVVLYCRCRDTDANKKLPEDKPFLDKIINGRATNRHNANLTEANDHNANLTEANGQANGYNANLTEANGHNANLTEANCQTNRHNANLTEANGHNANLTEANAQKQANTMEIVNNETSGEKVEMHSKTIIYTRNVIHHHHQRKQQEQKKIKSQETVETAV